MNACEGGGLLELRFGHGWNREVITQLKDEDPHVLGYEWVKSYGRAVGEDVFRTAYMCGRVREAAPLLDKFYEPVRPEIIRHFTGRTNLPKPEVRKVLLSRFGGDTAKKKGGVLHGISNHAWDALAVCIYLCEKEYGFSKDYWKDGCIF